MPCIESASRGLHLLDNGHFAIGFAPKARPEIALAKPRFRTKRINSPKGAALRTAMGRLRNVAPRGYRALRCGTQGFAQGFRSRFGATTHILRITLAIVSDYQARGVDKSGNQRS
jgi:hypothetical protein